MDHKLADTDLLIVVGERAQHCVEDSRSDIDPTVPRVLMDAQENEHSVQHPRQVFLPHEMPVPTWSDALRSQRLSGKDYRVMFLAADGVLTRAQQKQFASLTLMRVKISTRLVTTWAQWEETASAASPDNDLLVIGSYQALNGASNDVRPELQSPEDAALAVVKMTRAAFGKNIAATEVSAVDAGVLWAIEPEPGSLGQRAAQTGLVLLRELPASAVSAQTLSIAVDSQLADARHGLHPLFEAVARHQGKYR